MAEVPLPALERSYERLTRVYESLTTGERSYERCTRDDESLTRDHECLRVLGTRVVLGGLSEAGFAGLFWICRISEALLEQVRSYERLRALYERSRAFTRDCGRYFERARWATGDISVGLPARAGRRGYFYEFFHKYVRFVRSKACCKFEIGLLQIQCPCFATV